MHSQSSLHATHRRYRKHTRRISIMNSGSWINLNGQWNITSQQVSASTVEVPFCYDFKGKVSVTRSFSTGIESPEDYNYIICCDGINYQAEIIINGNFIVKHEGGFTPFTSPVAEGIIKESGNVIEVKIDNTLDASRTIPLKYTANYPKNYGGIYRDIYILAVPKLYVKSSNVISEIDINLNADIKNTVTLSATDIERYGSDKKFSVKTELVDTSGAVKAAVMPLRSLFHQTQLYR